LSHTHSPRERFPYSQQATEKLSRVCLILSCPVLFLSVHTDSQERQVHARTNHSCAEKFCNYPQNRRKGIRGTGKQEAVNHCNSSCGSSALLRFG
ncbi:hypothetical protein CPAR01_08562, partial [Colletotrichum paranaense]